MSTNPAGRRPDAADSSLDGSSSDQPPPAAGSSGGPGDYLPPAGYPPPPGGRITRWLLSADINQARRRMRWAWLAGLAWWVWNTGLLLLWMLAPGIDPDAGIPDIPVRIPIYYGIEGFVIGMLAMGVNLRWRLAAALLPAVFFLARLIALTRLEPLAFDARMVFWMAVYLLLLWLFIRAVPGAFSYHWHTHPPHP